MTTPNNTNDAVGSRKRTMSFSTGVTIPKKHIQVPSSGDEMTMMSDVTTTTTTATTTAPTTTGQQKSTTVGYNYGLLKLRDNCVIVKIDVDGANNIEALMYDDRVMITEFIDTAARIVPLRHDTCGILILTNKQQKFEHVLGEYLIVFQMSPDTVFELHHHAILQHLNPIRCAQRDSIRTFYDRKIDKQCMVIVLPSHRNKIVPGDSTLIFRNYTTMMVTTDDDDMSSKNTYSEQSINRKRQKKNEVQYTKICDNK